MKKLVNCLCGTKNVAVTCTTGMACQLYDTVTTLHSFAGLINSRMNVDELIVSVRSRESCLARWNTIEILIIDEVSQLSRKDLKLLISWDRKSEIIPNLSEEYRLLLSITVIYRRYVLN